MGTEAACDWTIPYADISSPLRPARVVHVPLFVEPGEKIKVDTRDGRYLGRVSS